MAIALSCARGPSPSRLRAAVNALGLLYAQALANTNSRARVVVAGLILGWLSSRKNGNALFHGMPVATLKIPKQSYSTCYS
eukprot:3752484-Rhodomonas_salina.1